MFMRLLPARCARVRVSLCCCTQRHTTQLTVMLLLVCSSSCIQG